MKKILLVFVWALLLTSCSGSGGGGTATTESDGSGFIGTATATEVPLMSTAVIPSGIYRLIYITKVKSQITWDVLVSGDIDAEFTWLGSGIYRRVLTGSGDVYIRNNAANIIVESIDCSVHYDTALLTLDATGKLVAVTGHVAGCDGLVSNNPAETTYVIKHAILADRIELEQRSALADGSTVTYHYIKSTTSIPLSEGNDYVNDYFSAENFSGSLLSL